MPSESALPGRRTRNRALATVLALLTFFALPTVALTTASPAAADTAGDMLGQLNAYRASAGVGPLRLCQNLTNSAQSYAGLMAATNHLNHVGPDGSTFVSRNEGAGYVGWNHLGENLANGYPNVASVLAAWRTSATHNANLLDGGYTDLGVGLAYSSGGTPYWVQEFGRGGPCSNGPIGSFDQAFSPWLGVITVTGWALDKDSLPTSIPVDAYLDGRGLGRFTANTSRPDVGSAYPGAGNNHGFRFDVAAPGGVHTICLFAISVTGGDNTQIGCKTVAVGDPNPLGSYDRLSSPQPGRIRMTGWTFDPEQVAPINVHVYADDQFFGQYLANTPRPDVGGVYPSYGPNHGFDITLGINGGTHNVCVYAINAMHGDHTPLGCRTIGVAPADPFGSFDRAVGSGGRITVSGWAIDPDTAASIQVHVYVDNKGAPLIANVNRPDVWKAFPAYGPFHGFSATLSTTPGTHTVCAYGINVSVGANRQLGCKTVTA